MPTLKLFLVGLPKSGKTEFIKSISDFPLVSVQKKIVSTEEMVQMDYGRVHINRNMVYLYAPDEDTRHVFLWESLHEEMHGFVLLVDVTCTQFIPETLSLHQELISISKCSHVIAFTKSDLIDNWKSIADSHQFVSDHIVMPCICTKKASVRNVIQTWLRIESSS